MTVKLDAVIAKTEAALAAETEPRKLLALQAKLSALLVAKAEMDDDDDSDSDDDSDDDDESKSKKAAKAADKAKRRAEGAKHRARAAEFKKKAAEAEEEAKAAEEEEDEASAGEEEDEASASAVRRAEADASAAARASADVLANRVAALEKREADAEKKSLIADALGKRITATQAKALAKEPLAYVRKFIEMSPTGLVVTSENELVRPKHVAPGTEESLPAETRGLIDQAVNVFPGDVKAKAVFRKTLVDQHTKAQLNGGRY